MLSDEILIRTKAARAGTLVREVFEECLRNRLQSVPYCDSDNRVTGRVTLKCIINRSIMPAHMIELAPVLSDDMLSFAKMETNLRAAFDKPIDTFVQAPHASISPRTALMKALAVMEHCDTSYLFVIEDGLYRGTLTISGIARWMMGLEQEKPA